MFCSSGIKMTESAISNWMYNKQQQRQKYLRICFIFQANMQSYTYVFLTQPTSFYFPSFLYIVI